METSIKEKLWCQGLAFSQSSGKMKDDKFGYYC